MKTAKKARRKPIPTEQRGWGDITSPSFVFLWIEALVTGTPSVLEGELTAGATEFTTLATVLANIERSK
jgi:hypothetical protein